ncbi:MAG: B12-binding domain-containing protein [Phycisphaerales bacterium JB039]
MTSNAPFVAQLLRASARAYAARATELLLERSPDSAARFGRAAFANWHDALTQRTLELAAAIEVGSPRAFAADVLWSARAFEARKVPTADLDASLQALDAALREGLPEPHAGTPAPLIEAAREALSSAPPPPARLAARDEHSRLAMQYLEVALHGDRRAAISLVTRAVAAGLALEDAYEGVLLPAEVEIGAMWHLGEASVAEEHAVTDATRSCMAVLSHAAPRGARRSEAVIVGAVEGDLHDLGVRAVSDLLEVAGWRVICLGANVPAGEWRRAVLDFSPALIAISATMAIQAPRVRSAIEAARTADGPLRAIVGGPAFSAAPELTQWVGADACARSAREAVTLAAT